MSAALQAVTVSSASKRRHRSPIILPIIYLFNMCQAFLRRREAGMCSRAAFTASITTQCGGDTNILWGEPVRHCSQTPSSRPRFADHRRLTYSLTHLPPRRPFPPSFPFLFFLPLQYAQLTYFHDLITFHIEVKEQQSGILGRHPSRAQQGGRCGR